MIGLLLPGEKVGMRGSGVAARVSSPAPTRDLSTRRGKEVKRRWLLLHMDVREGRLSFVSDARLCGSRSTLWWAQDRNRFAFVATSFPLTRE